MNNHSLTKFDFTNHIKSIFLQVSNFNFDLENTIVKKSLENFMKAILKASYVFLMRNIEKSEIKKEI